MLELKLVPLFVCHLEKKLRSGIYSFPDFHSFVCLFVFNLEVYVVTTKKAGFVELI